MAYNLFRVKPLEGSLCPSRDSRSQLQVRFSGRWIEPANLAIKGRKPKLA